MVGVVPTNWSRKRQQRLAITPRLSIITIFAEHARSRTMPRCLRTIVFAVSLCILGTTTTAFQPPKIPSITTHHDVGRIATATEASTTTPVVTQFVAKAVTSAATVALSAILLLTTTTSSAAWASDKIPTQDSAAQITLNRLPPSSISVQIKDLPVVGSLLSGSYSKIPDLVVDAKNPPSVVIKSPVDKVAAIQSIVKNGHLAFDIHGLIENHVEVDISAEKAGVMNVRVASDLIPKLPFTNVVAKGGKESPWNAVTNMGSGEVYFYNEKTGVTQYARPQI